MKAVKSVWKPFVQNSTKYTSNRGVRRGVGGADGEPYLPILQLATPINNIKGVKLYFKRI